MTKDQQLSQPGDRQSALSQNRMQLLERYLNAVRFCSPRMRGCILAALGDDIRAEIGNREHDLGHPLKEGKVSAILKPRGDPVLGPATIWI